MVSNESEPRPPRSPASHEVPRSAASVGSDRNQFRTSIPGPTGNWKWSPSAYSSVRLGTRKPREAPTQTNAASPIRYPALARGEKSPSSRPAKRSARIRHWSRRRPAASCSRSRTSASPYTKGAGVRGLRVRELEPRRPVPGSRLRIAVGLGAQVEGEPDVAPPAEAGAVVRLHPQRFERRVVPARPDPHVLSDVDPVAVAEDREVEPLGFRRAGGEARPQRLEAGIPIHQRSRQIVRVRGFRRPVVEPLPGDLPAGREAGIPPQLHQSVPEFVLGVRDGVPIPVADRRAGAAETEVDQRVERVARRKPREGLDEVPPVRLVADPVAAAELLAGLQQVAGAPGGQGHHPAQRPAAEDGRVGPPQHLDPLEEVRVGEEPAAVRGVEILPSPVLWRTTTCWSAKPRMFGDSVIRRAFPWIEIPGTPSKRSAKVRAASAASSSSVRTAMAAGAVRSGDSAREAVTTTVSERTGSSGCSSSSGDSSSPLR